METGKERGINRELYLEVCLWETSSSRPTGNSNHSGHADGYTRLCDAAVCLTKGIPHRDGKLPIHLPKVIVCPAEPLGGLTEHVGARGLLQVRKQRGASSVLYRMLLRRGISSLAVRSWLAVVVEVRSSGAGG